MSAAEGVSEASSAEQVIVRTDERVAEYFSLYSWLIWPTVRRDQRRREMRKKRRRKGRRYEMNGEREV